MNVWDERRGISLSHHRKALALDNTEKHREKSTWRNSMLRIESAGAQVTAKTCILGVGWGCVHWVRRPITGPLYQTRMIDDERGAVGGVRIGGGNRSTRRKATTVPFCPSHIPHDLTWAATRAAVVGSRRLTAWATARPILQVTPFDYWLDFVVFLSISKRISVNYSCFLVSLTIVSKLRNYDSIEWEDGYEWCIKKLLEGSHHGV
jgi:hypothetical protein